MNRKLIIVSVVAVAALMCGAVVVAWLVLEKNPKIAASLVGVTKYKPESRWLEEGLDPDVSTFDITGAHHQARVDQDAMVQGFVQDHYADLMPCYAVALETDDIAGRLDMRFGVKPDGSVALVEVIGSELENPTLEDCAVETARHWRLPPTGKETLMKFNADFSFSYE